MRLLFRRRLICFVSFSMLYFLFLLLSCHLYTEHVCFLVFSLFLVLLFSELNMYTRLSFHVRPH